MNRRLGYLDSLRGIAATVVALGHFAIFYVNFLILAPYTTMPVVRRFLLSPFVIIVDCDTAVCLFFVLSGFVLTKVFAAHLGAPAATLAGRAVRLFVPGFCACAYGFGLFVVTVHFMPDEAGAGLLGSWGSFLKDAFLNMPLLGYQGLSIFDHVPVIGGYLADQLAGANPPLWSLSVEWQGSLLVFALVALRRRHRGVWAGVMVTLALLWVRDWFVCFLFGHLVAEGSRAIEALRWRVLARRVAAGACFALGVFVCGLAAEDFAGPFEALVAANLPLPSTNDPQDAERLYAAMLIFGGVFGLTEWHRGLEHRALRWLGRMSFPIYLTHYPLEIWVVPLIFKNLPAWFWVASPGFSAISPQLEYPRAVLAAFVAVIVMTVTMATGFLAIDQFAIARGHRLRAALGGRRPVF
jgi:peptidoglycan/LPS O-acetylase OafA/YrhL